MRKIISVISSAALAAALLVGVSTPVQANVLTLQFPAGVEAFAPNEWGNVATLTGVTPAIQGAADPAADVLRVTIEAELGGLLRLNTAGLTAGAGFNLADFGITSGGARVISFSAVVNNLNTALATLEFKGVHGAAAIEMRVSAGTGLVLGDRYYEVYDADANITWANALKAAAAKKVPSSVQGANYECQGYLMTIESADEQALINANVKSAAWIGGSDEFNYVNAALAQTAITTPAPTPSSYADQTASEGKFYWAVGPSRGQQLTTANGVSSTNAQLVAGVYNNWNGIEPNNDGSTEHFIQILANGLWNDLPDNGNVDQYVVEYGGLRTTATHQTDPANVVFTNAGHMGEVADCVPAVVTNQQAVSFTAFTGLAFNQARVNIDGVYQQATFGDRLLQNSGSLSAVTSGTSDIGNTLGVGDFVDYYNVATIDGQQYDARITITAQNGMESSSDAADGKLRRLDEHTGTGSGLLNPWVRSRLRFDKKVGDEWIEYQIEFFTGLANSPSNPTPATLSNVYLSVYDVDSLEYFETSGFISYQLTEDSILSVSATRPEFTRFAANNTPLSGADSQTKGRVTVLFDSVGTFNLRLGQNRVTSRSNANFVLDFSPGLGWEGAQRVTLTPPAFVAPNYTGPVLESFSTRSVDACQGTMVTITGTRLSGITSATVQGKRAAVIENTADRLVIRTPAGLTAGANQSLVITSAAGTLTHQNSFNVVGSSEVASCALDTTKGYWTQAQADGRTIKIYAKNPVGSGKVQFIVDGREIAWVNAVDANDPKLRVITTDGPMAGVNYLVRTITLNPGKNRIEILVDGQRVWRVTYLPRG